MNYFNFKKIKKFISALIFCIGFLLFASSASAATLYVSSSGSNTSPYDTPAKAATSIGTAVTYVQGHAGPHTVYISPGTYSVSGYLFNLTNANANDSSWIGVSDLNTLAPASKGQITLTSNNGNTISVSVSGVTLKNISATNTATSGNMKILYVSSANFTGSNLYLHDTNSLVFYTNTGASNFLVTGSTMGGTSSGVAIQFDGTSSGILANNIFTDTSTYPLGKYSTFANGIWAHGTGSINLYNNVITGTQGNAIVADNTATVNVSNNVILAGENGGNGGYCISGNTVIASNNVCIGPATNTSHGFNGTVTSTNNIFNINPEWNKTAKYGYIIPRIDDSANYAYAAQVEQLFKNYGWSGTLFLDTAGIPIHMTAEEIADMSRMVESGTIEIGSHTYSHGDQTGNSIATVTSKSGTNPQYKVDLVAHTFSVKTDEGTWDRTYSLKSDNSDMMWEVRNDLYFNTSGNHWDFSYTTGCPNSSYACYYNNVRISSLVDTGGWIPISTALAPNKTCPDGSCGWYKDEIFASKSDLIRYVGNVTDGQTGLQYAANSFAFPFNRLDANSEQAVRLASYLSGSASVPSNINTASIDLYGLYAITPKGDSGNDTKTLVNIYATQAAQNGEVIEFISHTDSQLSSDPNSTNGWVQVIEALQPWIDAGLIKVMSAQKVAAELQSSPWTYNNSTGISTRTWTDQSDYSLKYNSSLIDAGISVAGISTDLLGNPIYGTPDIGAYEYQPPYAMSSNNIDVGSGARIYADGKFRNLNTASQTTAGLSITPQSGSFSTYGATDIRPAWLDVTNITWSPDTKSWTESNAQTSDMITSHTISGLDANRFYAISVTDAPLSSISGINGTSCSVTYDTTMVCRANGSGTISFSYNGGYSTHTFTVTSYSGGDGGALQYTDTDTTSNTNTNTNTSTPTDNGTITENSGGGGGGSSGGSGNNNAGDETLITQLQAQIQELISKINALKGQGSTTVTGALTEPLFYGSSGEQVILLQNILKQLGFFSKEVNSNGRFGPATLKAVQTFQTQYNIATPGTRGYGLVGPKTRAKLNELAE